MRLDQLAVHDLKQAIHTKGGVLVRYRSQSGTSNFFGFMLSVVEHGHGDSSKEVHTHQALQ